MRKAIIGLAVGLLAMATVGVASAEHTNPECSVLTTWRSNTYDVRFQITNEAQRYMVRIDGRGPGARRENGHLVFIARYSEHNAGERHEYSAVAYNGDGSTVCEAEGAFHVKSG